jgi:hypothetical protein
MRASRYRRATAIRHPRRRRRRAAPASFGRSTWRDLEARFEGPLALDRQPAGSATCDGPCVFGHVEGSDGSRASPHRDRHRLIGGGLVGPFLDSRRVAWTERIGQRPDRRVHDRPWWPRVPGHPPQGTATDLIRSRGETWSGLFRRKSHPRTARAGPLARDATPSRDPRSVRACRQLVDACSVAKPPSPSRPSAITVHACKYCHIVQMTASVSRPRSAAAADA